MGFSLDLKINAINDYLSNESGGYHAIASKYGVTHTSVMNWVRDREMIFQKCKFGAHLVAEMSSGLIPAIVPLQKDMGKLTIDEDQEKFDSIDAENKYLRNKVAYLEALLAVQGLTIQKTVKKNDLKPSILPETEAVHK